MQLETYPFRQTRAYRLKKKKKKRNAVTYIKKATIYSRNKINQKKKKKKTETLKPKTSFPIKIHTCSDYRFFSVPSNT